MTVTFVPNAAYAPDACTVDYSANNGFFGDSGSYAYPDAMEYGVAQTASQTIAVPAYAPTGTYNVTVR